MAVVVVAVVAVAAVAVGIATTGAFAALSGQSAHLGPAKVQCGTENGGRPGSNRRNGGGEGGWMEEREGEDGMDGWNCFFYTKITTIRGGRGWSSYFSSLRCAFSDK